ncbi:hypothetical protein [Streptomyces sp. NPDC020965]|uniref:hypothetical protein n=1 Tax=Streptomyces sp. NPDC020965 TaxID=3365105 RepID=UPI0037BBE1D5
MAGISTIAFANTSSAGATAVETPPTAVEDFAYPGAAKILTEKGIKLIKGDGQIVLADCDNSVDQFIVWTRVASGKFCFRALGKSGHLTLELDKVYAIQTAARPVSADLTTNGQTTTVNVPKDHLEGVGEGTTGAPTILVELRVTG